MAQEKIVQTHEEFMFDEDGHLASAAADVLPGYLVEQDSAGDYQAHSTAAEINFPIRVALPPAGIGKTIDDAIAGGEYLKVGNLRAGHEVYGMLSGGEVVAYGDKLVSTGDGTVRALDTAGGDAAAAVIAEAREAVDASAGSDLRLTYEVV